MAVHCCFGFYEDKERLREQLSIQRRLEFRFGEIRVHIRCFTIKGVILAFSDGGLKRERTRGTFTKSSPDFPTEALLGKRR